MVKPLGSRVYVERIHETETRGGLIIPQTFKARGPGQKVGAVPDYFRARVLAVGPDVRELTEGDEVLVYTYAEGDGSKLYSGETDGSRDKMLVRYPDDLVCAIDGDAA